MYGRDDSSDSDGIIASCIYCCCMIIASCFFFGGLWFHSVTSNRRSRGHRYHRYPVHRPPYIMPYKQLEAADQLCHSYYRHLEDVEANSTTECELTFFGFVAAGVVQYKSLTRKKLWIRKRMLPGGRLPIDYKNCYEMQYPEYGTPTVVFTGDCGRSIGKRLLFLVNDDNGRCYRRRVKCLEIIKTVLDNAKLSNWILPLYRYRSSTNVRKLSRSDSIVVMPIKNKFNFKYGDKPSQFSVVDPEYDCIAFDSKRNNIVTRDCEAKGCPICVNHLT